MIPAAIPDQVSDKQEEYERYRGLFTGMMSDRSLGMGLSVLLARGMKAWLTHGADRAEAEAPRCSETALPGCSTTDELAILLATLIGGV